MLACIPLSAAWKDRLRHELAAEALLDCPDDSWIFWLTARHRSLAYAFCAETEGRLLLGHIQVYNKVPCPVPFPLSVFLDSTLDMRGLGLGSQLLRAVIAQAKERGIKEIWGNVTEDAPQPPPGLLSWYSRHGFHVVATDAATAAGATCRVVLSLGNGRGLKFGR